MGKYRFNSEIEGIVRFQDLEPEIRDYLVKNGYITKEVDPNISYLTNDEIDYIIENF